VPQAIAHGAQLAHLPVELVGLRREHRPVDPQPAVRREHPRDLVEREARGAPERDQRQALQHVRGEEPPQATPARRGHEPFFFVVPERGGRDAGPPRHFTDVQVFHRLTSSRLEVAQ
jgi:hypothetical protein